METFSTIEARMSCNGRETPEGYGNVQRIQFVYKIRNIVAYA